MNTTDRFPEWLIAITNFKYHKEATGMNLTLPYLLPGRTPLSSELKRRVAIWLRNNVKQDASQGNKGPFNFGYENGPPISYPHIAMLMNLNHAMVIRYINKDTSTLQERIAAAHKRKEAEMYD